MSPIDDELRTALSSRTDALSVSPDFFTGIERRATRMRRQRVAAAVAGSALAVSALGLGGPLVASSLTSTAPGPSELATSAPSPSTAGTALDPAAPWEYRGDDLAPGTAATVAREWGVTRGLPEQDVRLSPLYGESEGRAFTLVFLASGPDGAAAWGVAAAGEAGLEIVEDQPLADGTFGLPYAFRDGEDPRLLVVAHPATTLEYNPGGQAPWRAMESLAPGVGVTDLDGDPGGDSVAVKGPDGMTTFSPPSAPEAEPEGPGTETPVDVDTTAYALDLDDPWAFRGPAELTLHPDLATQDERLFAERGPGRGDGGWSQRPLLAVQDEPTGMSVLKVLHRKGGEAYVTTTWQTQDEAPRQSEQPVYEGQLLVQTVLPDAGPAGVLIALASPRAGAVETDVAPAPGPRGVTTGVLSVELPVDPPPGSVFLYTEGDGLLYHSEPARRS